MPKFGVHHVVLANAIEQQLLTSKKKAAQQAGAVMAEHNAAAMLGAVGPDLFFFAPDYEAVKKILKFYENIEWLLDLYHEVMEPINKINEEVVEPTEKAVKDLGGESAALIEQLLQRVRDSAEKFKAALQSSIFAGVFEVVNSVVDIAFPPASALFYEEFFTPDVQKNAPISEWTWFDTLHYRRTGEFARNLVALASTPSQRAYAFGYLSHIATDVAGHPYVNCVVGAPYRLNVQRHVTAENYIDCWKFNKDFGESVNATLLTRLGLSEGLSDELAALIDQAFKATFKDKANRPLLINTDTPGGEGFLTPEQIHDTYFLLFKTLKTMQKMAVERPREPFADAAKLLDQAIEDMLETPSADPPPPPSKTCGWGDVLSFGLTSKSKSCYKEFFKEVGAHVKYTVAMIKYLFETLLDLCDFLLTAFLFLPVNILLAILYGIQLVMYEIYRRTHAVLAEEGFVYPEPDDLKDSVAGNLITPALGCSTHFPVARDPEVSHLVCPTGKPEFMLTKADFLPSSADITPDLFISEREFDPEALATYAGISAAADPGRYRVLHEQGLAFGNATSFTAFLVGIAGNPKATEAKQKLAFNNWNLDADRGYGYRVWEGKIDSSDSAFFVSGENLIQ